jgi:hypothetical protein
MDELSRAMRWLGELLRDRGLRVTYIQDVARRYGIAWMTIRRAKARLKIKALKRNNQWWWELTKPTSEEIFGDEHLDDPIPGAGDYGQF